MPPFAPAVAKKCSFWELPLLGELSVLFLPFVSEAYVTNCAPVKEEDINAGKT